jgi:Protein of unknown function (DUF1579)
MRDTNAPKPSVAHQRLGFFIGKWMNYGHTVATPDAPSEKILTSDIYEWAPGGFFVIHSAYGRIGQMDVGGIEIIGYDEASKKYRSYFYDSQGNVSTDEFVIEGDTTRWEGKTTRCTAVFTDNGKTQTAHHQRRDENGEWVPAMEVVLSRVD